MRPVHSQLNQYQNKKNDYDHNGKKVAFSPDGFPIFLNSHQLNGLAFEYSESLFPALLNAIVMINLGPHVKVFHTCVITIIIKFIVEWRARQYHGRFIHSNYCYKRATVTLCLHNKLPRPIYGDP